MPASPPVSLPTTLFFHASKLLEVDLGRTVRDAVLAEHLGFVHHGGDVQQRLRRDAADVEANASQRRVPFDQHGLEPEVGGAECGAVATGPRAQHQHLAFDDRPCRYRSPFRQRRRSALAAGCFGAADAAGAASAAVDLPLAAGALVAAAAEAWPGAAESFAVAAPDAAPIGRGRLGGGLLVGTFQERDHRAFADLVADLDLQLLDDAAGRARARPSRPCPIRG